MGEQDTLTQLIGDFFLVCAAGLIVVLAVVSAFKLYDLVRDTMVWRSIEREEKEEENDDVW